MIGDTISFMPSSLCKTEHLSITTERPAWSKFLPKKVNQKRQENYEKQVLKKIQEDTIEQLPKCDDFPSFKVRIWRWSRRFLMKRTVLLIVAEIYIY